MQNRNRAQPHRLAHHHRARALVDHHLGFAAHLDLEILDSRQQRRHIAAARRGLNFHPAAVNHLRRRERPVLD